MARPYNLNGGRPSAAVTSRLDTLLDVVALTAMTHERLIVYLRDPTRDITLGELRALALERVRQQIADAPTAA